MMFGSMPIKVAGSSIKVHYIRWVWHGGAGHVTLLMQWKCF